MACTKQGSRHVSARADGGAAGITAGICKSQLGLGFT